MMTDADKTPDKDQDDSQGDRIDVGNISDSSGIAIGRGATAVGEHGVNVGGDVAGSIVSGEMHGDIVQGDKVDKKEVHVYPPQNPLASAWEKFRNTAWIFYPTLVLVGFFIIATFLFSFISAGADLGPFQERLNQSGLIPAFSNANENEALILIAEFDVTEGNRDLIIHATLRDALEAKIKELALENAPRVEITPQIIDSTLRPDEKRSRAEEIGNKHDATLIIWGADTGAKIEVSFLNLKAPESDAADVQITETQRTQLAPPDDLSQFIFNDLPSQINFLTLFALGQTYSRQGDFLQAITFLEEVVVSIPDSSPLPKEFKLETTYFVLGWLHQTTGNLSQAIADYDQAIALNPQYADAYTNRGAAYSDQGELSQAIADYDEAIALNPQYAAAYIGRGNAYSDQGELSQAIADYDQAITLNPQDAAAYNNRGNAYSDQGELSQAIADYDQAIALNPQLADAYNNRGTAYKAQGELSQAIADHDQAIALNPQYADAFYNRGNAYADQGGLSQAIADYDQAIALNPQFAAAFHNRGNAYYDQGELSQAIADFQHYLELQPTVANRAQIEEFIQYMEGQLEQ